MLEFDSSINDTTESNGIQEDAETEIEPQLSESATSVGKQKNRPMHLVCVFILNSLWGKLVCIHSLDSSTGFG